MGGASRDPPTTPTPNWPALFQGGLAPRLYSDMFWNAQCGSPKVMVSSFPSPSRVLRVHYLLHLVARVWCSLPVCLRHTENAVLGPVHLCILLAGWRAVYPSTSCCGSGWRKAIEAALQRGFSWVFSSSGVPVRVDAGRLHLAATVGLEGGLWTFLFLFFLAYLVSGIPIFSFDLHHLGSFVVPCDGMVLRGMPCGCSAGADGISLSGLRVCLFVLPGGPSHIGRSWKDYSSKCDNPVHPSVLREQE